jgi:hypothetical protein
MSCRKDPLPSVGLSTESPSIRGDEKAVFTWNASPEATSYELSIKKLGSVAGVARTVKTKGTAWSGCLPEGSYAATVTARRGKEQGPASNAAPVECLSTSYPTWDEIELFFQSGAEQAAAYLGQEGESSQEAGGGASYSFETPAVRLFYAQPDGGACIKCEVADGRFLVFGIPFGKAKAEDLKKALTDAGVEFAETAHSGGKATATLAYSYYGHTVVCSFSEKGGALESASVTP